jgi:Protein of unknown function (DUF3179)
MQQSPRNRVAAAAWIAFAASVLTGFALFFFPAFVIRPFRYQAPSALSWAMRVRQVAPFWTLAALLITALLAFLIWARVRRWGKGLLVLGLVLATASAVMARINYFEWMFHHLSVPGFEAAASSKLDGKEMVMAVGFGNDARAYPIREMAYHHVVNDVVGGVPIAVTY